ncbi:hypothetical protein PLA107_030250 (plasmid) [Pseudomonas amygdali pv. lachrymans str. M301315]|uniref:Uncharacterized protein n=4 Tax=Pseudomonas syringae group genomosp. 2 TaxID=251698 RepID=A0ABR5KQA5_PSEAV|nr:hypothetical protein PLA107_030250 [Pseudomonas amygdali pv. lachrymans str. M301315]KPC16937.1 Uncharacterized protein AC499_0139 [Pseudomonas amygdali pv. lachrymans]KPC17896.1 Uncharacterized protein AC499_1098 [Pseudomonas amygdali pv. lachrymans]
MGLDDEDERLLWEYVAAVPKRDHTSVTHDAIKLLELHAETNPVLVQGWSLTATIDDIYVKPAKGVFAKMTSKPLVFEESSTLSFVCYDTERLLKDITEHTQVDCFNLWRDRLRTVLREDGVNWNPPVSTDITVKIELKSTPLLPGRPPQDTSDSAK